MKHLRFIIVCFTLLGLLTGCTATQRTELASNSDPDDESGIGGTGIIGTITGFGSIFVNGVEVEVERNTRLSVDGQPASDFELARGNVVEVLAVEQRGVTHASRIQVRHEIIGKVEHVDSANNRFTVLGQTVLQDAQTGAMPRPGDSVQISGFRDATGDIHATRVAKTRGGNLLLSGTARTVHKGSFYIGKQKVSVRDSTTLQPGTRVQVRGRLRGTTLEASSLAVLDSQPFGNSVQRLLVQGFISKESGQVYRIDGVSFINHDTLQARQSAPLRVEIKRSATGEWAATRLIGERGLPLGRPEPRPGFGNAGHAPAMLHRPSMPPRPGMGGAGRPMR